MVDRNTYLLTRSHTHTNTNTHTHEHELTRGGNVRAERGEGASNSDVFNFRWELGIGNWADVSNALRWALVYCALCIVRTDIPALHILHR